MGQATVDLPDPLETPPPASVSGTDDLLAQIAGDEIDRLLAESGLELPDSAPPAAPLPMPLPPAAKIPVPVTPAPAASATAPPAPAAPPTWPPLPALTPASVSPQPATRSVVAGSGETRAADERPPVVVDSAPTPDEEEPAGEAPPLSPELLEADAELDALLDEMSRAEREGLSSSPTSRAETGASSQAVGSLGDRVPETAQAVGGPDAWAEVARTPPAPAGPRLADVDASEPLMSPAERDALSLTDIAAETDAAEQRDAAAAAAEPGATRVSFGVRLLELLNAPLAFVPDGMRDAMGKIAILTLVNSLAVLIYVLFLRG